MLARLFAFLRSGRSEGVPAPAETAPAPAMPAEVPPATAALTARDMERLRGVHPDLVRVVTRARGITPFFVAEGVRSVERQRQMILAGLSRVPLDAAHTGRHVTGHAVDLYPISDTPIPRLTRADYEPVARAMAKAAALEGVPLTVAHFAWKWDSPHYELPRGYYP
jgi:peptidoglycan L-alanyl-D-glutamate endopeptidase CwlK